MECEKHMRAHSDAVASAPSARSAPSILGQSSRRMRSLTIADSQQVYAAVKRLGATVGATFDAALRLAVLFQAASQHGSSTERLAGQWKDRKFVLFPVHVSDISSRLGQMRVKLFSERLT